MATSLNLFCGGAVGFIDWLDGIDADFSAWLCAELSIAVKERPRFVELLTVKDRVGFGEM